MLKTENIKKVFELKNVYKNSIKYKKITILGISFLIRKTSLFYMFRDMITLRRFEKNNIRNKSVLLVEPNPFHGEILPGFVKYFQDLDFNVDLLLRYKNVKDNSLYDLNNVNIYPCSLELMRSILGSKKIKNYEICFITTSALWDTKFCFDSFLNFLGFEPKAKNGIFLVEHNITPYLEEYDELKYLKQNRLFTLSGFQNTPMLNPHFFINNRVLKNKNKIAKFIVTGHMIKEAELLFNTANKLIRNNINNFKIYILGKNIKIPKTLNKNIFSLGYVNFKCLYKSLEQSDFILALLNSQNENHKKYLFDTTFGAKQQSLGFYKPLLINKGFAEAHHFNQYNSIVYNENDLYEAMQFAIKMSNSEYYNLTYSLKKMADEVYMTSLNNLKNSINSWDLNDEK